jgi:LL-diaminopimelate aminotransferase
MMYLNYPNNPTGGVIDLNFLNLVVEFAKENNIIVCYDNAYSEITFDGYKAPSILEVEGGKDVAIEFNSCSKTFNMTGDRIGFAVGNKKILSGLVKVKSQIDSGPPVYIQKVAVEALNKYVDGKPPKFLKHMNEIYAERRNLLIDRLQTLGFNCFKPLATFYVWVNCGGNSLEFTSKLLDVGVVITPGVGFGKYGEGYVRLSITQPKHKIMEACERIAEIF